VRFVRAKKEVCKAFKFLYEEEVEVITHLNRTHIFWWTYYLEELKDYFCSYDIRLFFCYTLITTELICIHENFRLVTLRCVNLV